MAKANPKLNKLRNILLAVIPGLVIFGLVFAANTYYDLDLQKVVIEEVTKIVGQLETTSTTTLATSGGNVGVGTSTPAYTLDVAGTSSILGFRMPTGASSTYVLTSDGSGVGTWQEPPGIEEYARSATKVVCATDTLDTTNCDYNCDGINDEEQINQAIQSVTSTGGLIQLMEGTYTVATSTYSDCSIKMASSTALVGQGASTIIKLKDGFDTGLDGVICNSDTTNGDYRILLSDFKLDGSGNSAGSQDGIYFEKVGSGTSTAALPGVKIQNLWVESFRGYGVNIVSSSNNTITGSTIQGNNEYGIRLALSSNNTITGNTCQGNINDGIYINSSSNNTVTGNTCQGNSYYGIHLSSSSSNNTISGNTCQGNSYHGIRLISSSNNTITGNTCQGNTYEGIKLYSSSNNNTISSNACQENGQSGIHFDSSSNNTVIGNTCQGNTYYGIHLYSSSNNNTISGNKIYDNGSINNYDGITILTDSHSNLISSNDITDTAGGGYAIDIGSGCQYNYLADNRYSGTGASSIRDLGTNTVYGSQLFGTALLSTSTASDLILKPLGNVGIGSTSTSAKLTVVQASTTGDIVDIQNATGSVFTIANDGTVTVAGNIMPSTTTAYDLGSDTYRWQHIYSATSDMDAFKMDTNATSGYVLTSDSEGIGTWQEPPGIEEYARSATKVVCATDTLDTTNCDYNCDGINDEEQINQAIQSVTSTGGLIQLMEGTYTVATSTYSDCSIKMASSTALVGQGASTVIKLKDNFNTSTSIVCNSDTTNGDYRILLSSFKLDGNEANQASGVQRGIYFNKVGSGTGNDALPGAKMENIWVEDFNSYGIYLYDSSNNALTDSTVQRNNNGIYLNASSSNNTILSNIIQDNDPYGIALYTSCNNNVISGNSIQGHSSIGIYLTTSCNNNIISSNVIQENTDHGIYLFNSCNNNIISSNVIQENAEHGIYLHTSCDNNTITGNTCQGNGQFGIHLHTSSNSTISGNTCQGNRREGIYMYDSYNNTISGNTCLENSQGLNNVYDNIALYTADYNLITANVCRRDSSTSTRYGIYLDGQSDYNMIEGNDLYDSGATADLNDAGTGNIKSNNRTTNDFLVVANASSTNIALTVTQTGSGNIMNVSNATGSVFTIANDGTVTVAGNILPSTTTAYDLGSDTYRWRYIYSATSVMDAFKMDTNATSGYVLTSDSEGIGTWQEPPGIEEYARSATKVVCATDTLDTTNCDYNCDGTNDEEQINQAIQSVTSTGGLIQLMEGTYTVATSTYSDCSIKMASSTALVGQGASTIIKLQDNFDEDVNVICNSDTTNGNYRILLSDFKLDGSGNSTGTQNGVYFNKVGSGTSTNALPGAKIQNLWVEDFRTTGIYLYNSSNNTISGNTCQGNGNEGIRLTNSSNNNTISGNTCQGNGNDGIFLINSSNNNTISGNTCQGNSNYGIYLATSSSNNTVSGNTCQGNMYGIRLINSSNNNTISGNTCQGNSQYGILVQNSSNNTISGNICLENSQATDDAFDNIYLYSTSTYNLITGNVCRQGSETNKPRYGINISSGCDYNVIQGNDLYDSGATGDLNDDGTGNIKSNNRTTNDFLVVANASSTNTALTITQNGTGTIMTVSNATGTVFTIANDGTVTVAGDILPATTTTYSLGSDTYKWANIHTATATMDYFKMSTGASSSYVLTSVDDSGVGTWQSLADIGEVTGTGTANYLTKWSGASTLSTSTIYDNGTFVGIGTTTAYGNEKLTIYGDIYGSGNIIIADTATTTNLRVLTDSQLGTVSSGTWQGSVIGTNWGGTGTSTTPIAGAIIYGAGTTYGISATGTTGQPLLSGGTGIPTWGNLGTEYGGTATDTSDWTGFAYIDSGTWSTTTEHYGPTLIVAASNSTNTSRAHYQCDGTNDEATIEQAIAVLPAGGGTIQLLEGTFSIDTDGIDITSSNIAIVGQGPSTILQRGWDATSDDGVITIGDGGTTTVSNVIISNLAIDGCKDGGGTCASSYSGLENAAIYLYTDITRVTISNNYIHDNYGRGVHIVSTSGHNNNQILITENNFVDNFSQAVYAADGSGTNNYITIDNNLINAPSEASASACTVYDAVKPIISNNNIIAGCGRIGLGSDSSRGVIVNNIIESGGVCGSAPVGIFISAPYSIVSNNYIDVYHNTYTTEDGIYVDHLADYTTISNNIIKTSSTNAAGDAIEIKSGATDIYLDGNTIYGNWTNEISDSGTDTIIQHRDQFEIEASSTVTALTVSQTGTGTIANLSNATGSVFTIANDGTVTVAGDILPATTTTYSLGSDTYKWANIHTATATMDYFKMSTGASSSYVLTSIDASGVGTWSSLAGIGGVTGTGLTNYLTKWTGNSTLGTSTIYDNGTYVGIGTGSPAYKLDVVGDLRVEGGANPVLEGNWDPDDNNIMDYALSFYVSGKYAYVAGYSSNNLAIVDISNPANPTTTGNWDPNDSNTMEGPYSVYVSGKYAYVAGNTSNNLAIVDISDPSNPTTTGNWDPNNSNIMNFADSVYVSGKYAYVAGSGSNNLVIVDISDPANPTTTGNWDPNASNTMEGAGSVYVSGKYAYVAGYSSNNLAIVDISNPANPTTTGNWDPNATNTMEGASSVYVSGRYAYVAGNTSNNLAIVDISNPANPTTTGNWDPNATNTMEGAGSVYVSGKYAYVAGNTSKNLAIVDISNPANPTTTGNWDPNDDNIMNAARSVYVSGKYAYVVGWGSDNLVIVDLGGIETPNLLAGTAEVDTLHVNDNAIIQNNLYVQNGLNVGPGGLYVDEGEVAFAANSGATALTVLQNGSGNIMDVKNTAGSLFTLKSADQLKLKSGLVQTWGGLNDVILDDFEDGDVSDWTSSDVTNTPATATASTVKVNDYALKIATAVGNSGGDMATTSISSEDWSSYERLSFWIRADYATTSTDATTTQIISCQFHNSAPATTSEHNVTIKEMTEWQYEEWDISEISNATSVDWIGFVVDNDYGSPTFYIDQLRLYGGGERAAEMFVDAEGNVVLLGQKTVELYRTIPGGSLPSIKTDSAVVEVNQPLSVNVGGDVGFDYDIYFANTGLSSISSEGPLQISAGDTQGYENLTLTTGGTGDIIMDIASSTIGFKMFGSVTSTFGAYVFRVSPTGQVEIGATTTISGDILPVSNDTYSLGSATYKWANLYAVTTTVGDVVFANALRITESTSTPKALVFKNTSSTPILTIDENGYLTVEKVTAKVAKLQKLEMVDQATGETYCTWIENGEWMKELGECVLPEGESIEGESASTEEGMEDTGGDDSLIDDGDRTEETSTTTEETSTSTEETTTSTEPVCEPSEEICDGLDNDCDGLTDEDLTKECGSSSIGACQFGIQTCSAGIWGECVGAVEPVAEICEDGIDNNCDGEIDENCEARESSISTGTISTEETTT